MDNNFPTKYRPKTYGEVVGQDIPKAVLKRIAQSSGISCRSIFLHGAWGSGKTSLARIFAKSMNCSEFLKTGEVCNCCEGCLESSAKNSQLYMEFDATTAGNIDSIRALHDKLSYLPPKGGRRVVVLDEVHSCVDYRTPIYTTEGSIEASDLVKHRKPRSVVSFNYKTGKVETRPIIDYYNNGKCDGVRWFRCQWNGGVARVTENHEFFFNGELKRVSELPNEFYADCIDYNIPDEVNQIIIGTLLGDSTLVYSKIIDKKGTAKSLAQTNVEPTFGIQMMQGEDQLGYLKWKASKLGPLVKGIYEKKRSAVKKIFVATTLKSAIFSKYVGLHNTKESFKDIGRYLPYFGPYTWLVWYLDDGNLSKDGIVTISCTNIGIVGADNVIKYAKEVLGWDINKTITIDKRSNKPQIRLYWTKKSSNEFLQYISGLIEEPCIKYKIPNSVGEKEIQEVTETMIPCGRKVIKEEYYPKNNRDMVRYNISVEETENYTLPGGLLTHNCSTSALNALLKLVEEGIPDTIFVFCSTEDILPTLKSRSICLDITTVSPAVMSKRLEEVARLENIDIDEKDINTVCLKSKGHMRDALSILQLYTLAGKEVLKTPTNLLTKYVFACLKKDEQLANSLLLDIMNYPVTEIINSIATMIKSGFTSKSDDPLYQLHKSGIINKLFGFFYTPVAQQAMKSEIGMELLLRSFLEKTNPHG